MRFVVVDGVVVRVLVFLVVGPAGVKGFAGLKVGAHTRNLRLLFEIKNRVENAVVEADFHRFAVGEDLFHLLGENAPIDRRPKNHPP